MDSSTLSQEPEHVRFGDVEHARNRHGNDVRPKRLVPAGDLACEPSREVVGLRDDLDLAVRGPDRRLDQFMPLGHRQLVELARIGRNARGAEALLGTEGHDSPERFEIDRIVGPERRRQDGDNPLELPSRHFGADAAPTTHPPSQVMVVPVR